MMNNSNPIVLPALIDENEQARILYKQEKRRFSKRIKKSLALVQEIITRDKMSGGTLE
jgi:hypothetical protein